MTKQEKRPLINLDFGDWLAFFKKWIPGDKAQKVATNSLLEGRPDPLGDAADFLVKTEGKNSAK